MTAYLRAIGASLTGVQDFCGPFAKPQRMAVLTLAALGAIFELRIMTIALIVIAGGTLLTLLRRNLRLAAELRRREGTP